MLSNNLLKKLPQSGVTPLHRSVGSAALERGDNFIMDEEIWYDIPNYVGYYQISNLLRIRSLYFYKYGKFYQYKNPKIRKINTSSVYPMIVLGFDILRNKKNCYMHKLVAQIFIPNPNNYKVVMHRDDIKSNYSINNLEWGTHKKNNNDAFYRGRITKSVGSKSSMAKINESMALDIFNTNGKGYKLAKKYNISYTAIYNIKNGLTWNHVTGLPCSRKKILNL